MLNLVVLLSAGGGALIGWLARDLVAIAERVRAFEEGRSAGWAEAVGRETA